MPVLHTVLIARFMLLLSVMLIWLPCGAADSGLRAIAGVGEKYGLINEHGRWVMPPRYGRIEPFSEGLALVCQYTGNGFIDPNGKVVIPFTYVDEEGGLFDHKFNSGVAVMEQGQKDPVVYYVINRQGKVLFKTTNVLESFSEGLTIFTSEQGHSYYIDPHGRKVLEPKDAAASYNFYEGLAPAMPTGVKDKVGFINTQGKLVIKALFDDPQVTITDPNEDIQATYYRFQNGYAVVSSKGRFGIIDRTGKYVIPPAYDDLRTFSEGLALVCSRERYGFLNTNDQFAVQPQYEEAESFAEGLALVKHNGKYGFIDHDGKMVIPAKFTGAHSFACGLAAACMGKKWGFIDNTGTWRIPPTFTDALSFQQVLPVSGK